MTSVIINTQLLLYLALLQSYYKVISWGWSLSLVISLHNIQIAQRLEQQQYDYERRVISDKDLIYKRLKNEWARCGQGFSFRNAEVPRASSKRLLTEREPKSLTLVLMTDFPFFFCKFPEPIIFPFLSFGFTQGLVLLALGYLKEVLQLIEEISVTC